MTNRFIPKAAGVFAVATALGALVAVTPAFAQTAPSSAPAATSAPAPAAAPSASMHHKAHHPRVPITARVEQQISTLHAELKITPDEEQAWGNVAQAMRDNAKTLDDLYQKRATSYKTASALDNLTSYQQISQAHADGMKAVLATVSDLYAKMPDSQKKIADAVFRGRPGRAMGAHKHKASASAAPAK
jgi:hypothetical protein